MPRIGYARVSSLDQDLDGQLARLQREGCTIVRSEKVSGVSREGRPELATVLQFLRAGDELVVTRLDRLGRDTRDVLNLIHECEQRGASVTVLDPQVSTRGQMGHVVLTVLGMVAQMERRFIKDVSEKASTGQRLTAGIKTVNAVSIVQRCRCGEQPEKALQRSRGRWVAAGCRFTGFCATAYRLATASLPIQRRTGQTPLCETSVEEAWPQRGIVSGRT